MRFTIQFSVAEKSLGQAIAQIHQLDVDDLSIVPVEEEALGELAPSVLRKHQRSLPYLGPNKREVMLTKFGRPTVKSVILTQLANASGPLYVDKLRDAIVAKKFAPISIDSSISALLKRGLVHRTAPATYTLTERGAQRLKEGNRAKKK